MDKLWTELQDFLSMPNIGRTLLIVAVTVFIAYWIGEVLARVVIKIAQRIAVHADRTTSEERQIQLRRVETYLGVTVAVIRATVVGLAVYLAIKVFGSRANAPATAIGASAFFVVLAGGTVGLILRDLTAGISMIIERWFNVGDHIRVEPFADVAGVVERMTLRSTKLRSLNGEVIWLHNQYIMGVKVTPRGLRTIAVDIFVNNEEAGLKFVERVIQMVPTGPLLLARPLT
ncbi:MAG: mechanosensitive ion channel MscS, small conductance mechanosensitive channel, partial [Candidatus Saccharibacteria bacterium]|nr:mechanosensitive ion channel MscS, small conductance mechanosensitive channel [Candidatus Saccharibacteria bacterium]